jgi:hypothetical protein
MVSRAWRKAYSQAPARGKADRTHEVEEVGRLLNRR